MTDKRLINFNAATAEDLILKRFAEESGRSRTDVLREAIRALEPRLAGPAKAARQAKVKP
jgi:hypothetical protein